MITDINDHIIVKDNFFSEKIYKAILFDISKLKFENRNTTVYDDIKNIYQRVYFNVPLNRKHFAIQETINILNSYGLNVGKGEHNYFLSSSHEGATIHKDEWKINCIVYIKGQNLMNSGTGFYDFDGEDKYDLRTHVGFRENRAIIFDSKIYHSTTQFEKNSGTRYIIANFFDYKEKTNAK